MTKLVENQIDENQLNENELTELEGGFICLSNSGTNYADEDDRENIVF